LNNVKCVYIPEDIPLKLNYTDERDSPQEAKPVLENSSLGFIEAVH